MCSEEEATNTKGVIQSYGIWPYQTFKKLGIPGPWPLPFLGTFLEYWPGVHHFDQVCFEKYGKIWEFFGGRQPVLAVLDPVLIKNILVKECYSIFTSHWNFHLNGLLEPALNVAEDEQWEAEGVLFPFVIPVLAKMKVTLLPSDIMNFFKDVFIKMKKKWEKGSSTDQIDYLKLMIESQNSQDGSKSTEADLDKTLSDEEILAQALIFVFAGCETTSSTLSYTAYNLSIHPDVQQRLQDEVDSYLPNKGTPTYTTTTQMEYLDMVVNESIRLQRVCKNTVENNGVTIPKDMVVMIPAFVLHRDPQYWPEPDEFRPERFSKEKKESLDPYTFLPFRAGPRNYIGMRFALLVIKVAVVMLLQNFCFRTCKDTPIPLVLDSKGFVQQKKPIILKMVPTAQADLKK